VRDSAGQDADDDESDASLECLSFPHERQGRRDKHSRDEENLVQSGRNPPAGSSSLVEARLVVDSRIAKVGHDDVFLDRAQRLDGKCYAGNCVEAERGDVEEAGHSVALLGDLVAGLAGADEHVVHSTREEEEDGRGCAASREEGGFWIAEADEVQGGDFHPDRGMARGRGEIGADDSTDAADKDTNKVNERTKTE